MLFKYDKLFSKDDYDLKKKILKKFANNITDIFIDSISEDNKNYIICFNIDNQINEYNITSLIVYRKIYSKNGLVYIILLMASHPDIRNVGYAKIILDEFIKMIKEKNKLNKNISIVLHSLESSYNFYKKYGFIKINNSRFIKKYEGYDNSNKNIILKYNIL